MGTRCDFYTMEKDKKMIWIGSYGWDGYPDGPVKDIGLHKVKSIDEFKKTVLDFLEDKEGYISGKNGWPWPWDTSATTDYSYIFFEGNVYVSCYGSALIEINDYLENDDAIGDEDQEILDKIYAGIGFSFPDMSKIKDVDMGEASGTMVFSC